LDRNGGRRSHGSEQRAAADRGTGEHSFQYVSNADVLLDHGCAELRRDALEIFDKVLEQVDPLELCRQQLKIDENFLQVGGLRLALLPSAKVWFFGAGKASYKIARGVEDRLGARLHGGLVVCKEGQRGSLERIDVLYSSHPIPSEASVSAAREMYSRATLPRNGDIVICGVTGGSTALLTLPCDGLALADLQSLTEILLTCGADIFEINAVRKHVSKIAGGRLALAFEPGVQLVNLTVSDVIGDALDYVTDPTVADTSTIADARATLDKYSLWERVSPAVKAFLEPGGAVTETPKSLPWPSDNSVMLLSASSVTEAARSAAEALGYRTMVLSSSFDGESQALGQNFAAIAREIAHRGGPLQPPCAIIGGGETIVRMNSFDGLGGPNQEFALAGACHLPPNCEVVLLAADTDGTDGPTQLAGAICDNSTVRRAKEMTVDIREALDRHTVTPALIRLGDAISTGATGSNVNDLKLMLLA
jgi:glycerate 2-kinase